MLTQNCVHFVKSMLDEVIFKPEIGGDKWVNPVKIKKFGRLSVDLDKLSETLKKVYSSEDTVASKPDSSGDKSKLKAESDTKIKGG